MTAPFQTITLEREIAEELRNLAQAVRDGEPFNATRRGAAGRLAEFLSQELKGGEDG